MSTKSASIFQFSNKVDDLNKEKINRIPLDVVAIENNLKEILLYDTPISMMEAAKILGRDRRVLYSHFLIIVRRFLKDIAIL